MDFSIAFGLGGWALLFAGAIGIGFIAQIRGEANSGYEWVPTGIGAAIGAVVASEFVVGWRTFEPVWDGLALVPALIGGLIVGGIVAIVSRNATADPYGGRTVSA